VLNGFNVIFWGMNIETQLADRSESMKRAWAARRAAVEMEASWSENPICLCGCAGPVRKKEGAAQTMFLNGHDAKLKGKALKVIRGKAEPDTIPSIARALWSRLGFLKTRPELIPAFKGAARNPENGDKIGTDGCSGNGFE
jgi:hypothetical protein